MRVATIESTPAPLRRHLKSMAISAAPHLRLAKQPRSRLTRKAPGRPAIGPRPDSHFRISRARRRFVALIERRSA
jgi:hypothetical protein